MKLSYHNLLSTFEFNVNLLRYTMDGMPDLAAGDGSGLKVSVFGSLAFEWTAMSSEVKEVAVVAHMAFTQGDVDAPTVRVTGDATFTWPCVNGSAIAFSAIVDIRMGVFIVEGAAGNASVACGTPRAGAPTATLTIAIDRIGIKELFLTDVLVHADLFKDDRGMGLIGSIEGGVELEVGSSSAAAALGDDAALFATFHFDSFTNAIRGGALHERCLIGLNDVVMSIHSFLPEVT